MPADDRRTEVREQVKLQHTLRFRDDDNVLFEEHTLAYGLVCGYERGAEELGVPAGKRVRMELLDAAGHVLDWRTYQVAVTGGQFPSLLPEHPTLVSAR